MKSADFRPCCRPLFFEILYLDLDAVSEPENVSFAWFVFLSVVPKFSDPSILLLFSVVEFHTAWIVAVHVASHFADPCLQLVDPCPGSLSLSLQWFVLAFQVCSHSLGLAQCWRYTDGML